MTVRELIKQLEVVPPDADVMFYEALDECDLCAHAKGHKCSLAGVWSLFVNSLYYHEASNEVRLRD